eukprot:m.205230 g.205230  ORF g.205230 m.205230 type:complete len:485 (-) comp15782_c0_seq21:1146-2600(-)
MMILLAIVATFATLSNKCTPPTSTHSCILGSAPHKDAWKFRTCHYRNLLRIGTEWFYIVHKSENYTTMDGEIRRHLLVTTEEELRVSVTQAIFYNNWSQPIEWAPTIIDVPSIMQKLTKESIELPCGSDSTGGDKTVLVERTPTFFFHDSPWSYNFGHVISDELLPTFTALHSFGLINENWDSDVQAILHTPKSVFYTCAWYQKMAESEGTYIPESKSCTKLKKALWPFLSNREPTVVTEASPYVLYKHTVVGMGFMADHCADRTVHGRVANEAILEESIACMAGRSSTLRSMFTRMRNKVEQMIKEEKPESTLIEASKKTARIVVWMRPKEENQERYVEGMDEFAMKVLPKIVSNLNIPWLTNITFISSFAGLPILEQAMLLYDTAVFVSSVGGGGFVAFFLPEGSTVVRVSSDHPCMEWDLFQSMSHFQFSCHKAPKQGFYHPEFEEMLVEHVLKGLTRYAIEHNLEIPKSGWSALPPQLNI